ncbi:MAG: AAA family ATPase [Bacteroidales bacterium]|nr:AAA family ATPase [Bacteroidales bacterium]
MKILAIRGKNIASLDGEFEVDFTKEPLLSSGIYTISGPTGSGKSTILDTLCLALYNTTPRLKSAVNKAIKDVDNQVISSNSSVTLLRRGSSEGYAEAEFIAVDGDSYRVRWMVRRSKNKPNGKIQSVNYSIHNITKSKDLSCGLSESLNVISGLVGLTYDQFSRAVLLAQGEFSAFLKADDSSRASLLEKITGTEIFADISRYVFEKKKEIQLSYDIIIEKMNDLHILPKEDYEALLSNHADSKKLFDKTKKEIEENGEQIKWYKNKKDIQDKIDKSQNEIEKINAEIEAEKDIFSKIDILNEIREFQNIYISRNNCLSVIKENEKFISVNKNRIEELQNKISVLNNDIISANNTYEDFNNKKSAISNDIKEAVILENNILSLQNNYDSSKIDLDNKIKERDINKDILDKSLKAFDDQQKEHRACAEWLDKNKSLKPLFENQQTIIQTLSQLFKQRKIFDDAKSKSEKYLSEIDSLNKNVSSLCNELNRLGNIIRENDNKISNLQTEIKELDFDALNKQNKDNEVLKDSLIALLDISKSIDNEKGEVEENNKIINSVSQLIISQEKELVLLSEQKIKEDIKLEQTETIENEMRLRIGKDVESLRALLKDDQECPVCGSKIHPFSSLETSVFHSSFDFYTQEKKKLQISREEIISKINSLSSEISHNKETVKEKNENNEASKIKTDSLFSDLRKSKSFSYFETIDMSDLTTNISNKIAEIRKINEEVSLKIDLLNKTNTEISNIKEKNDELKKNYSNIENQKNIDNNNILNIKVNIEQNNIVYNNSVSSIKQLREDIQVFFEDDNWWVQWKSNCDAYQSDFVKNTNNWNQYFIKHNNLANAILITNEKIKGDKTGFENSEKLVKNSAEALSLIAKNIEEVKDKRSKYFDNKPISKVEEELAAREKELKADIETRKEALSSFEKTIGIALSDETNAENRIAESKKLEIDYCSQINMFIDKINITKDLNIDFDIVDEIFSIPSDAVKSWEKQIKKLSDSLIAENSSLETHKNNLSEHLKSVFENLKSEEELFDDKVELEKTLESIEIKKNEFEFKIKEQQNKELERNRLDEELSTKRQILDRWAKLNDTIGSADGNKFRIFAQGFTLDVLLQNANYHLKDISPRYMLQRIPNQLALQVIDRDMCDNVRSVYSLSGGETFLVSLGLALGLSSLSGKHMNIETLFIDEGFGSLDQETLSVAMDALESLRLQGKKVGVITHVKEMTERISTKVLLEKINNGASSISIQG